MMMICNYFKNYETTLKKCSLDTANNNQYMTNSEIKVINFDKVKENYAQNLNLHKGIVSSVDAIYEKNDVIYFIEFKNGKIVERKDNDDDRTIYNIKYKVRDSLLIYNDLLKTQISETRKNVIFILVYNEEKNPIIHTNNSQNEKSKKFIHKTLQSKSAKENIRFKMEQFEKIYFKEVHTYTEKEFDDYIKKFF